MFIPSTMLALILLYNKLTIVTLENNTRGHGDRQQFIGDNKPKKRDREGQGPLCEWWRHSPRERKRATAVGGLRWQRDFSKYKGRRHHLSPVKPPFLDNGGAIFLPNGGVKFSCGGRVRRSDRERIGSALGSGEDRIGARIVRGSNRRCDRKRIGSALESGEDRISARIGK